MPSGRCPRLRIETTRAIAMAVGLAVAAVDVPAAHATFSGTLTGTQPSGATYLIEVPPLWNGTLVLYSHGTPFGANPTVDAPACGAPRVIR